MRASESGALRVALLAGTLDQGGAEKQLMYMTRVLKKAGVDVRVYSLTRGEYYDAVLSQLGTPPEWVGGRKTPPSRLIAFARRLRSFRPHVVQAVHFFTNLYVALAARMLGAIDIGSLRGDGAYELEQNGRWGPPLLRTPRSLMANSELACENARAFGVAAGAVHMVPNVIDLTEFDAAAGGAQPLPMRDRVHVMAVGRLVAVKRYDLFLKAVAAARRRVPAISASIVGDGPERGPLEKMAMDLELKPPHLTFLGRRSDVPRLLRAADMLSISSAHEGFPNVLLEAMAAGVPTVTTAVGDAARIIEDEVSGYVVPFGDVEALSNRIVQLSASAADRQRLGGAARREVERRFSLEHLGARLLATYGAIAAQQRRPHILPIVRRQSRPVVGLTGAAQ